VGAESVWVHNPLGIFCFCAAWTHLGSAVTHVWPDSFTLARRPPTRWGGAGPSQAVTPRSRAAQPF